MRLIAHLGGTEPHRCVEVDQVNCASGIQQNVSGLQIAVQEPAAVDVRQPVADLQRELHNPLHRKAGARLLRAR